MVHDYDSVWSRNDIVSVIDDKNGLLLWGIYQGEGKVYVDGSIIQTNYTDVIVCSPWPPPSRNKIGKLSLWEKWIEEKLFKGKSIQDISKGIRS